MVTKNSLQFVLLYCKSRPAGLKPRRLKVNIQYPDKWHFLLFSTAYTQCISYDTKILDSSGI
jgi:hypothetical protein